MKKKWMLAAAAGLLTVALSMPAYAGEWKQDEAGWWYQNEDGSYPNSGWSWVDGKCYYFTPEGYCLVDTQTPDGYTVDASGAWVVDGVVQTQEPGGSAGSGTETETGTQTVAAGTALQMAGLTVTVPSGFVQDSASTAESALFYHTGQEAAIMIFAQDMPDVAEYQELVGALQGIILDEMMEETFGTPTSKGAKQFSSGTWYTYDYMDATMAGAPVSGSMHVYARVNGTALQMVVFLGDFSGMDVDGIMNQNVR